MINRIRFLIPIVLCYLLVHVPVGISAEQVADANRFEELVERLGSESFATREAATLELLAIGTPALAAIQEGASNKDREIRYRSRLILRHLDRQSREKMIREFVTGTLVTPQQLPGWKEFSAIAGKAEKSRILFGQMLRYEWHLLEATFRSESLALGELVLNRLVDLERRYRGNQASIPLGSFAACLFVAGEKDVFLREPIRIFRLCDRTEVRTSLARSDNRDSLRRFLGRIIAKRLDSISVAQQLLTSSLYNIPEGLDVARRQVANPKSRSFDRQQAILLLAKLGTQNDIPLLESALDDDTVTFRVQRVQIREVALAAILHLSGENHKDYGFDNLRRDATWVFQPISLALNEKNRKNAIEKWRSRKNDIAVKP